MYKNSSRGFTLIELLVVIAIIGILSAVVLASLSTARSKGQDASIQSDLSTIQTQAEIFYGNTGNSYGTTIAWPTTAATQIASTCTGVAGSMFADPTIKNALTGAWSSSGSGTGSVGCAIAANGVSYIVATKLTASTTGAYWCVDSTGVAKGEPGIIPTAATASCP